MAIKTKNNEYWFYIDTDSIISVKEKAFVIYNSLNGKILEYYNQPEIFKILQELTLVDNLGVIKLTDKDLKNPIISGFCRDIRENHMGDLIDVLLSAGKPKQMIPKLSIMEGYETPSQKRQTRGNILEYLSRLTLYINDFCKETCHICNGAFKQFPCCTSQRGWHPQSKVHIINKFKHFPNLKSSQKTKSSPLVVQSSQNTQLDFDQLKMFLDNLRGTSSWEININGGNIFKYSKFQELIAFLNSFKVNKSFTIHYRNAINHLEEIKQLNCEIHKLIILVHFPLQEPKLHLVIDYLKKEKFVMELHFIIESETDFQMAEKLVQQYSLQSTQYHAFFNGENFSMFEENVYVGREDIIDAFPSLKEIYTRQFVNPTNFGSLIILPDGRVHANINDPQLGYIHQHSIYDLVYDEMVKGTSWRKPRKNVRPCNSCAFNKLCPPITNYNYAMGKGDLCHIKNECRP